MIRVKIRCTGRVQGVFFRKYTSITAKQLDIVGWVRNEPDGTVLICAEGEENRIEKLINWCRTGSPSAQVEDVSILEREPIEQNTFDTFEISQ